MTEKQHRFVEGYAASLNASEAARQAGYSPKTAGQIGHELLKKPEIRRAVDERLAELSMSTAEVTARLTAQARGDLPTCIKQSGEDRIEIYDSQAALDKLARVNGLYESDSGSDVEIVLIVSDISEME